MTRGELDTLLAELCRITGPASLSMIGSQCVHAATVDPPAEVLMSRECDILIENDDPLHARLLEAAGKASPFYDEHGIYLDAVSPSFPFLPEGWEARAATLAAGELTVRCLALDDLALSKLAAGRLKDNEMIAALVHTRLIDADALRARILAFPDPRSRAVFLARLQMVFESLR